MGTIRALLGLFLWAATSAGEPYRRYGCGPGFNNFPFCNTSLTIDERVADLISRLTLDEKPYLMVARESPLGNVSRLGVPQFNWGLACQHVVASRCGRGSRGEPRCPTSFPQPNLLGATFNESTWSAMARIMGVELRALWKQEVGENRPPSELPLLGLDCWSPNINLVRDPRWGRNMETPSEDPYLLGRFGIAITKALQQGEDPKYLQAIVSVKHFVANSLEGTWTGPGGPAHYPGTGLCPGGRCTRHTIDPNISVYDLVSSYLPAFKASVVEGKALGVMCSYNSVNGAPSCANDWLLNQKLRKEWGFDGYVAADTGAVEDIWNTHFYSPTMEDGVIDALNAGTDVESAWWPRDRHWSTGGKYIDFIAQAVRSGKLSEEIVDRALARSLKLRFRLGLFDPPENQRYEHVSPDTVQSPEHVAASIEAAEQGLVLLKNAADGQNPPPLPITRGRLAIIGPHAVTRTELLGNYNGQTCPGLTEKGHYHYKCVQTLLEAFGNLTGVTFAQGLPSITSNDRSLFPEAISVTHDADIVVLALGLDTAHLEAEDLDRHNLALPEGQLALFDAVRGTGTPTVVVLFNGGAVAMSHLKERADAIIEAWYPGAFGATAVARSVLGHANRWGKLPVTIYDESFTDQFDMLSFDMTKAPGRTYRYFTGEPLWPFGFGLSYTTFGLELLSAPNVSVAPHMASLIEIEVTNTGLVAGDEVLMAFFKPLPGTVPPGSLVAKLQKQLLGFRRVSLDPGHKETVQFNVSIHDLALFTDSGDQVSYPGNYELEISNGLSSLRVQAQVVGQEGRPSLLEKWRDSPGEEAILV